MELPFCESMARPGGGFAPQAREFGSSLYFSSTILRDAVNPGATIR